MMKVLKTALKEQRKRLKITQTELAESVGTCRECIGRLERNEFKNPAYELLYMISEYFQKPVEELFWYEDEH